VKAKIAFYDDEGFPAKKGSADHEQDATLAWNEYPPVLSVEVDLEPLTGREVFAQVAIPIDEIEKALAEARAAGRIR
jgi:hypothetical protein